MKYLFIFIMLAACSSVPEIITERIDVSSPVNATCHDNATCLARALCVLRYENVLLAIGRARPTDAKPHAWVEFMENGITYIADPAALMTVRKKMYTNSGWRNVPGGEIEYVIARTSIPQGYYVKNGD